VVLYATVKLYGKTGIKGEFRAYETKALNLFRRHGGEVVVAYAPRRNDSSADVPDEVQVLRIPGLAEFERFMKDPERLSMAQERERVIRKTEVFLSEEIIEY
jgi:uncharacterized protein (DUF1330 family)